MTHELAKQLKDAGFESHFHDCGTCGVKSPTLGELIEACMDFYYPSHFNMGGMNIWWAVLRDERNTKAIVPVQIGSTPEEAVGKLWIALKKQDIM